MRITCGNDYRPGYRHRSVRRDYRDEAPARKVAKVKRAPKTEVADPAKARPAPAVQTAKLEDKLSSDPATTTVIEKTPDTSSETAVSKDMTTGSIKTAPATTEKAQAAAKSDKEPAAVEAKHVCRRYSPAIAGLVDVPCE